MLEAPILPANPPIIALPKQGWRDNILINLNNHTLKVPTYDALKRCTVTEKYSLQEIGFTYLLQKTASTLKIIKCFLLVKNLVKHYKFPIFHTKRRETNLEKYNL